MKRFYKLIPGMMIVMALLLSPTAFAQGDGTNAADASGSSFAEAFFIARTTDISGNQSVEVLGSLIIWFLLLLSVLSIGLIGYMALTNQRKSIVPDGVVDETTALLKRGSFKEAISLTGKDQSYFSTVLHSGLSEAGNGFSAMIRSLEIVSDEQTTIRLRRIEYLNVLGQVSPMIGLFGTVYGMIMAFQSIVQGGDANPVLLAGGIGTALTTTFWGLVVAIPALAGYAIVRNRIDALTSEATHIAEHLVNQFRPKTATRIRERSPEPKPQS